VEDEPQASGQAKIVLVAGSSVFKPGEHDYLAGCAALVDLLKQTPGVAPVLAVDWPKKPQTLAGARSLVLFFNGGDQHGLLSGGRMEKVEELARAGVGLVQIHQVADYPAALGTRARALAGGAWEKGHSKRAHWVARFQSFPDHPIFRGVAPFAVDDGWLTALRFQPGMKGVTPLLRTVAPADRSTDPGSAAAIVAWAYERPDGGRSFTFTGGHLHRSLAEAGYRRFLVNGILWSAGLEVPASGAPVALDPAELDRYLTPATPARARSGGSSR
jgi:type 1 glutamine amidotransferase